jgi:hypothetical protein
VFFLQSPHTGRRQDGFQQLTDRAVLLQGVPQVGASVDDVRVAPAVLFALQDPCLVEVGNDPLRAALGNADLVRNFTQRGLWRLRQAYQHVRVVAEKCPVRVCHGGTLVFECRDYRTRKTRNK